MPSARRFRRSRASPGATSARRSRQLNPGAARGEVHLQPVAAGIRQGVRHGLSEAGPARAIPGVPLQAAAEGRPAAAAGVQGADEGGRGAVSRELQGHARAVPRRARRARRGRLDLPNTDFDTGKPSAHGEYTLADETYAELLHRLTGHRLATVPDALRQNINAFYAAAPSRMSSRKERKRAEKIKKTLRRRSSRPTRRTTQTR